MRLTRFVVPCRRFRVEVHYGEAEGLSASEQMLLRAVVAGARTLDALHKLLGLPSRMLLDICIEMLHDGLLQVERPSGQIQVSAAVKEAMGDPLQPKEGWAKVFASPSPPSPDDVDVLQDSVSGSLFRRPPWRWEEGSFQRAPVDPELPEPDEISKTDLVLVAASRTKEAGGDSANDPTGGGAALRSHRVVNVSLKRLERAGAAAGAAEVRGASVLVTARCFPPTFDDDGALVEPPRFVIVEPREIPISVRRRIAAGLTRLADRGVGVGRNQFFRTVQYDDELVDVDAEPQALDPATLASALKAANDDLAAGQPSADLHARLVEVDAAARDTFENASRNRGEVTVVSGAAAHRAAAIRALEQAEQQVILGCPWMRRLGVDDALEEALTAAARRGVHIHLLWGVSAAEEFASNISEAAQRVIERADAAGRSSGGAVFLPKRSCASHAKLIVCDLDWMVVGSSNYLNAAPDRATGELGLLVSHLAADKSQGDGRPAACMPVIDVATWCRSLLRDFKLKRSLADDPVLFGRQEPVASLGVTSDIAAATWGFQISEQLWASAWKKRVAHYQSRLSEIRSAPAAVFDGDHRDMLFEALAKARHRVVVASPRLGLGLLGRASLAALTAAVQRPGLEVVVLHSGEQPSTARERQRLADERPQLRDLVSKGLIIRTWDSHAKLLLFDDQLVIGSFNYLSFEGYYGNRSRARHELSVRLWSPEFADKLWEQVQRESAVSPP